MSSNKVKKGLQIIYTKSIFHIFMGQFCAVGVMQKRQQGGKKNLLHTVGNRICQYLKVLDNRIPINEPWN